MSNLRRHALGGISLLLIIAWGILLATTNHRFAASLCLRAGLVLGSVWLAFPQLLALMAKGPPWVTIAVTLGAIMIVARPRSAVVVIPVLLGIGLLQFVGWLFKPLPKPKSPPARPRKPGGGPPPPPATDP